MEQPAYHEQFWVALGGIAAVIGVIQVASAALALRLYPLSLWEQVASTFKLIATTKLAFHVSTEHEVTPEEARRLAALLNPGAQPTAVRGRRFLLLVIELAAYIGQGLVLYRCLQSLSTGKDMMAPATATIIEIAIFGSLPVVVILGDLVTGDAKKLTSSRS